MSQDFLSQDEVDALLKGVSGEAEEPVAEKKQEDGVRPYNLATEERIVRARMPAFEMVNERFARQLRVALFNFLRRNADVTISTPRVQKFSDFVRNLVVPTNLNLVQIKLLHGNTSLFIIDPNLVFLVGLALCVTKTQSLSRHERGDLRSDVGEVGVLRRLRVLIRLSARIAACAGCAEKAGGNAHAGDAMQTDFTDPGQAGAGRDLGNF